MFVVGCSEFDWVVGWVGSWVQIFSLCGGLRLVGSVVWWVGLGWVEEIGPTDNSMLTTFSFLNSVHACHVNGAAQYMLVLHGEGDDENSAG